MKALPLHQPWAQLVALGKKRIETRAWTPPASLFGTTIAIHATAGGLSKRDELALIERNECIYDALKHLADAPADPCLDGAKAIAARLPRGAVICTVRLVRVTQISAHGADRLALLNPEEHAFGDYTPGRFAWILDSAQALAAPVPTTGRQGIFDVPDHHLPGIPAQLPLDEAA